LVIQAVLAIYNVDVVRDAMSRGLVSGYPSVFLSLRMRLLTSLVGGGIPYLGFALVGIVVAGRGHRSLFILPAAGYVLITVAIGSLHQPQALGNQWELQCFTDVCEGPWFAHPWLGPLVDFVLVLLPGLTVAVRVRRRRWPPIADPPTVAAILATVAVVAMAGWTIAVIENRLDGPALVAVTALGIGIGTARPWWPWLHVLFASVVSGALAGLVGSILLPTPGYSALDAVPYVIEIGFPILVVGLLASGWQPLAWLLRRSEEQPLRLLVAVNLLNVVDAVMTAVAVRSGGALEANPVVRFGGLPAKVIFVGVLTWLLYRRRPSALVWPATALLVVACYHVSGILVNGWRT
jgi:hypothetical protein